MSWIYMQILHPESAVQKNCRGIKCIKWGEKEDDYITMPSSLDYLGRSWGGQNSKSVGGCGAVRSGTGKCTTNADTVWTEDRNFWRGAGRGQKFSAHDISTTYHPLALRYINGRLMWVNYLLSMELMNVWGSNLHF